MTTVDPVRAPSDYQRMLLDLVGDDDPAAVQALTPSAVRNLVSEAGEHLRTRPMEGEWSVVELIGHILDAEIVLAGRYRWILAQDAPALEGYDQDRWVQQLGYLKAEPMELIAPFEALRAANLALWRRASDEQRARVGLHRERGPESFELSFRLLAGHDRFHLAQAERTLLAVLPSDGSGGPVPATRRT